MKSLNKLVARQDANYKLTPSSSNETSINLSNDISNFISDQSGKVTFILHKKDFVKSLSALCLLPAIYHKKDKQPSSISSIFDNLSRQIESQFGVDDTASYTINLYKRDDGRSYFNELKASNGFNLRAFLVEQYSILTFQKIDGELHIRLSTTDNVTTTEGENEEVPNAYSIDDSNSLFSTLAAVRTKPFLLLAGISGTGKSRIVRKMAQATVTKDLQGAYDGINRSSSEAFRQERWTLHRPANFELIQVKPNWHNSMDVVGYLSNIPTPHYVFTPFINFIVRAMCHPETPFFLCLDEMNLAPVEEYFAEFLSAIESRAKTDESYMTDPIIPPFKTYGKVKDQNGRATNVGDDMIATIGEIVNNEMISDEQRSKVKAHLEDKGVTLPENLIIVGTVNMDETTFSFSRKVLDRAMSLEMNKVDYSSFLSDSTDDDIKAIAQAYDVDSSMGENQLNKLLVDRHVEAKEVVPMLGGNNDGSEARFVIDYLETINKLLDGTPFKLGYRAANEALIYLQSTKDLGSEDKAGAMDRFTLMKILSRIEGDESKLRLTEDDNARLKACGVDYWKILNETGGATLLTAMKAIILKKLGESAKETTVKDDEIKGEEQPETTEKKPKSLESVKKIDAMIAQLDRDHFVSYWS